jgi:hypothetical protein
MAGESEQGRLDLRASDVSGQPLDSNEWRAVVAPKVLWDFRLPPQCRWGLYSSGLCSVCWWLLTDVSGHSIGAIVKGQCLALENGTHGPWTSTSITPRNNREEWRPHGVFYGEIVIITEQAYGSRTCTLTQSEDYTISALLSSTETCFYWANVLVQKVSKCVWRMQKQISEDG